MEFKCPALASGEGQLAGSVSEGAELTGTDRERSMGILLSCLLNLTIILVVLGI